MRHFIVFLLLVTIAGFSQAGLKLTAEQEYVRLIAKQVGEENCLEDICFTQTLQAIAWQESSFGKNIIGDNKGRFYYYKHMGNEISISKADTFVSKNVRYTWYQPAQHRYIKKVYSRVGWKPLSQSSLGAFQIQIPTAKRVIEKMKLENYYGLLSNEEALVNYLLKDVRFGATIAVNYLKMNYLWAKGKYRSPWRLAVSRYNGGNANTKYINAILRKIKQL